MLGTGIDEVWCSGFHVYFMKVKLRNTVYSYEVQLKYKYCNFDRLCVYMLGICWFSPDSLHYNQWEMKQLLKRPF